MVSSISVFKGVEILHCFETLEFVDYGCLLVVLEHIHIVEDRQGVLYDVDPTYEELHNSTPQLGDVHCTFWRFF